MGEIIYPGGRVEFGLFCMWEKRGGERQKLSEKREKKEKVYLDVCLILI